MALHIEDLKTVRQSLHSVNRKWYDIGLELNIHADSLNNIASKCGSDPSKGLLEMLNIWLRQVDPIPTWESIVTALEQPTVGEGHLALQLREKYCNQQPPVREECQPVVSPVNPTVSNAVAIARENQQQIKGEFVKLQMLVCKKLQTIQINIQRFLYFIKGLFQRADFIPASKKIDDIFEAITRHGLWDFINYSPLRQIAKAFAKNDEDINTAICTYRCALAGYLAGTKLADHIASMSPIPEEVLDEDETPRARNDKRYFNKLSIKLKAKVTEESLDYLTELWDSLSGYLCLPSLTYLLDEIHEGCVSVVFLIPPSAMPAIDLKINDPETAKFFSKLGIIRMEVDDLCLYEEQEQSVETATEQKIEQGFSLEQFPDSQEKVEREASQGIAKETAEQEQDSSSKELPQHDKEGGVSKLTLEIQAIERKIWKRTEEENVELRVAIAYKEVEIGQLRGKVTGLECMLSQTQEEALQAQQQADALKEELAESREQTAELESKLSQSQQEIQQMREEFVRSRKQWESELSLAREEAQHQRKQLQHKTEEELEKPLVEVHEKEGATAVGGVAISEAPSKASEKVIQLVLFFQEEIMTSVKPLFLLPHLERNNLVSEGESEHINCSPTNHQRTDLIIQALLSKGEDAIKRFADALFAEKQHPPHQQLAKRLTQALKGSPPTSPTTGPSVKDIIYPNMPAIVEQVNLKALLPYLMRHGLVIKDDVDKIQNTTIIDSERIQYIISELFHCGEGAVEKFIQCLIESGEEEESKCPVPAHIKLAKLLIAELSRQEQHRELANTLTRDLKRRELCGDEGQGSSESQGEGTKQLYSSEHDTDSPVTKKTTNPRSCDDPSVQNNSTVSGESPHTDTAVPHSHPAITVTDSAPPQSSPAPTQASEKVQQLVLSFKEEIMTSVKPTVLLTHLQSKGLVTPEEAECINSRSTNHQRTELIIQALISKGEDAIERFTDVLFAEKQHPPHQRLAKRLTQALEGSPPTPITGPFVEDMIYPYMPAIVDIIYPHLPAIVEKVNPIALLPYLMRHGLVIKDDVDKIQSTTRTDSERIQYIILELSRCAEEAVEKFIRCLMEEKTHPPHQELAELLIKQLSQQEQHKELADTMGENLAVSSLH